MGFDIAVGVVVLIGAIRGWFRGFVLQAVRLASLVGSVFLAAPVRGQLRPYVAPYLATIRADLLDRMLWWASAVLTFLVLAGVGGGLVRLSRRQPYGDPEASRLDQSAGSLFAAAKAALVAAFLVAALDRHAADWIKSVRWAEEQTRDSMVLAWERQYRPADTIWASTPVQQLVAYVRRNGLAGEPPTAADAARLLSQGAAAPVVPTTPSAPDSLPSIPPATASATGDGATKAPRLGLPPLGASDEEVAAEIDRAVRGITPP